MKTISTEVRWLIREDMSDVLAIDAVSFAKRWTAEDFVTVLKQRQNIGVVAEMDGVVVGYMVYSLAETSFNVLRFAVDPDVRQYGIGRHMFGRLFAMLSSQRRDRITLTVDERALAAQLFLGAIGFRAVAMSRGEIEFQYLV